MLFVLLCFQLVFAAPPRPLSATYKVKSTELLGSQYQYGIFEIDFDQQIYYSENIACPCEDSPPRGQCPLSRTFPGPIDETGHTIIDLSSQYDQWVYVKAPSYEIRQYKFNLDPTIFGTQDGCPTVRIQVQNIYGETGVFVANDKAPTSFDFTWQKIGAARDGFWICPYEQEWRWGWWYFTTSNAEPAALFPEYRVKWTVVYTPMCPTLIPPPVTPQDGVDTWILLEDQRAVTGTIGLDFQYARYYVPTTCTNFSVQTRQLNLTQIGDLDLYISLTNPEPTLHSIYDWAGHQNGPDQINLFNLCSPDGSVPWPIYVGFYSWNGPVPIDYLIVASTSNMGILRPILDDPPLTMLRYSNGGYELDCGEGEEFRCLLDAYAGCNDPLDDFHCCSPFTIIPPFKNAYPPFTPNFAVATLASLQDLDWPFHPDEKWNQPNKMVFALLMSVESPGYVRSYAKQTNLSKCVLKWRNCFVNDQSEPMEGTVTFTEKKLLCDAEDMRALSLDMEQKVEEMAFLDRFGALRIQEFNISEMMFRDLIYGCQALFEEYTDALVAPIIYTNQTSCDQIRYSEAYNEDPCCSKNAAFYECCHPYTREIDLQVRAYPENDEKYEENCEFAECVQADVFHATQLIDLQQTEQGNLCTLRWSEVASDTVIHRQTAFIRECRNFLLGNDYHLLGTTCLTNADCQYDAQCSLSTLRCLYTDDHVLECFADRIDPTLAQILVLDVWDMPEILTRELLISGMKERVFVDACRGWNSIKFRTHTTILPEISDCIDGCTGIEPRCYDEVQFCPIDETVCPLTGSSGDGICWRHWGTFVVDPAVINTQCVIEQTCNYLDCEALGLDQTQCAAQCLPNNVCLACEQNFCRNVGFSEADCRFGCTIGKNQTFPVNNSDECATMGICSQDCSGCDQATCLSLGECSYQLLFDYFNSSGVTEMCFRPHDVDEYGAVHCDDDYNTVPWGCPFNTTNEADCGAEGYLWLETWVATSKDTCEIIPPQCFQVMTGVWSVQNETECLCSGNTWKPMFEWNNATWIPGVFHSLNYTTGGLVPIRTVQSTIDYFATRDMVEAAVVSVSALEFSSYQACLYGPYLDAYNALSCDCTENNITQCFTPQDSTVVALQKACPKVPFYNNATSLFQLTDYGNSFPLESLCQIIIIQYSEITHFQQKPDNSFTSEVFLEKPPNKWAVVKNHEWIGGIVCGQVTTSAIIISFNFSVRLQDPLYLCIPIREDIEHEPAYNTPWMGLVDSHQIVRPYREGVIQNISGDRWICGNISQPGAFIGLLTVYDPVDFMGDSVGVLVQSIIAAVLYGLIVILAIIQAFIIIKISMSFLFTIPPPQPRTKKMPMGCAFREECLSPLNPLWVNISGEPG